MIVVNDIMMIVVREIMIVIDEMMIVVIEIMIVDEEMKTSMETPHVNEKC